MDLYYHLWNPPQADIKTTEKLVLLHGMGGTGALWRPLAAALENDFFVLAPDQRGHGKSQLSHIPGGRNSTSASFSPENGYTPLDYGKDLVETLDRLSFFPAWILGHSMGVRTAVATAHLRPERVQGLILIDLGFSGVAGGGLGDDLGSFLKLLPTRFNSRDEAKQFMALNCPDPAIGQYLMAVSVRNSLGQIEFPFDHSALIQTIHAARDSSVRLWVKDLGSRGIPIVVLRGKNSLVWSKEAFEKEKEEFSSLPSVEFHEVENAGHGLPFEQRQFLVQLIRTKMKAQSSSP